MVKLNESQKRYKILFENHVSINRGKATIVDKAFERRIKELRELGWERILQHGEQFGDIAPFDLFMYEYKFPKQMKDFLYHFIITDGEIDYTLIKDGLLLVSDLDELMTDGTSDNGYIEQYGAIEDNSDRFATPELKFVIGHDTTLKQAKDFLTRNWQFVEDHQKLWRQDHEREGKTIRPHLNSKRDYRIIELLEQGFNPAYVSTQIEKEYNGYAPTYMAIAKIKSRIKKNKNEIWHLKWPCRGSLPDCLFTL